MAAYYWLDNVKARGSFFPSTAIRGGTDRDGSPIYVGQGFHNGDWIPAKVIPSKNAAYVPYGGKEISVSTFKVLCEQRFDWVKSHDGQIPQHAVEGGRTSNGEILYVGRADHNNSLTIGKVHPSHKTCYIPFNGDEIAKKTYEVLVLRH